MTTIIDIEADKPNPGKCKGTYGTVTGEDEKYQKCKRYGRFLIDGEWYCKTHAGDLALYILMNKNNQKEES